jgi:hypothetical protein
MISLIGQATTFYFLFVNGFGAFGSPKPTLALHQEDAHGNKLQASLAVI